MAMHDTNKPNQTYRRPSKLLLASEGRAMWELGMLPLALPWLRLAPAGDGHAVLVLPGLTSNDSSTLPMRLLLGRLGYASTGWELGRNRGPRGDLMNRMLDKLTSLRARSGRKVSVVGWSLGGVYARELARAAPDSVRQVVALGSPLYGHPSETTNLWAVYRFASGKSAVDGNERGDSPPPVPMTSIFSRSDGVVAWQASMERPAPLVENIEIYSSHLGLGHHAATLYAVANRLSQPEDQWMPFEPRGLARHLYRRSMNGRTNRCTHSFSPISCQWNQHETSHRA